MFLASRALRLTNLANAIPWAIDIAHVMQAAGAPTTLWSGMSGTTVGSVVFSTPVGSIAEYVAFSGAASTNAEFLALTARAGEFVADIQPDGLAQIIHGDLGGGSTVGSFVTVINANGSVGKWSGAGAWAIAAADLVKEITGIPVAVTTDAAGAMGRFGWISLTNEAAGLDAAAAALNSDARYMSMLETATGLFDPGATRVYARRIA